MNKSRANWEGKNRIGMVKLRIECKYMILQCSDVRRAGVKRSVIEIKPV